MRLLKPRHNKNRPEAGTDGFTLIELMVTIAVLATVLTLAAPAFVNLIRDNRMVSNLYALRATLNNARSEAIARRAPVIVCPTTNGTICADSANWNTGYMTFIARNGNNAPDSSDPDEERIQWESNAQSMDINFTNAARQVRYNAQGNALGFEGTFSFCDERGAADGRGLILNASGSLRSATLDSDANGTLDEISC